MKLTLKQTIKFWLQTKVIYYFRFPLSKLFSRKDKKHNTLNHLTFNKTAKSLSPSQESGITVILNTFQRIDNLQKQIQAIKNQSVPPIEIWLWSNKSDEDLCDVSTLVDRVIACNGNFFSWAKFAIANLVRTKYIAFLDDDIKPQQGWLENCIKTIENGHDGIIGGSGIILPTNKNLTDELVIGWDGQKVNQAIEVDFANDALFLNKKHLNYIWREDPPTWHKSENIHLCYMAQKYGNVKVFVPPHPEENTSIWSCDPIFGNIAVRSKRSKPFPNERAKTIETYINDGWKTVSQRNDLSIPIKNIKNFNNELLKFTDKLINHENFSLVRFGDGEMLIIKGEPIDLSKSTGGFKYTPDDIRDEQHRKILAHSLSFKSKTYYVGLPARCCVGDDYCDSLRELSKQAETQLTWASIFVNNNYHNFLNITVEAISKRVTNIICFNKARLDNLPFKVNKDFRIGINAWVDDFDKTLDEIDLYIHENKIENQVFIFCSGVLSNMLIYKLSEKYPHNTYIDVGSVFDLYLSLGKTRRYLKGNKRTLGHACIW